MGLVNVPAWAGKYVGIPYLDLGRTSLGCDCWGLVRMVMLEESGISLPCYGLEYGSESDHAAVALVASGARRSNAWEPVGLGDEIALDVVEMTIPIKTSSGWRHEPLHVGIVVTPGLLLHVEERVSSVLASYRGDVSIAKRIVGFWRRRV